MTEVPRIELCTHDIMAAAPTALLTAGVLPPCSNTSTPRATRNVVKHNPRIGSNRTCVVASVPASSLSRRQHLQAQTLAGDASHGSLGGLGSLREELRASFGSSRPHQTAAAIPAIFQA